MSTQKQLKSGDIFRRHGAWFRVTFERDDHMDPPERAHDGHGDVSALHTEQSDDELRAQGYWVLSRSRGHVIVYGARTSLQIAIRDGWARGKSLSAKRRAVKRDYELLRGWYQDEWHWTGVIVERMTGNAQQRGQKASVWGIESSATRYLSSVARELADEVLDNTRIFESDDPHPAK